MIILFYKILYRLHLVYCFFFRPKVYGAYCIIRYEDKRLIIKNSYKDYWTVPCGMVDTNESYLEAAVRETEEEVGVNLDPKELTLVGLIQSFDEYKEDNIYLYGVRLQNLPEVTLDGKEVVDYRWVTRDELKGYKIFGPIKDLLLED